MTGRPGAALSSPPHGAWAAPPGGHRSGWRCVAQSAEPLALPRLLLPGCTRRSPQISFSLLENSDFRKSAQQFKNKLSRLGLHGTCGGLGPPSSARHHHSPLAACLSSTGLEAGSMGRERTTVTEKESFKVVTTTSDRPSRRSQLWAVPGKVSPRTEKPETPERREGGSQPLLLPSPHQECLTQQQSTAHTSARTTHACVQRGPAG